MSLEAGWQTELLESLTSLEDLVRTGLVTALEAEKLEHIRSKYKLRIPRYYANLIDRTNLQTCPIRAQAIPSLKEVDPEVPAWVTEWSLKAFGRTTPWDPDPIGDLSTLESPRISHRYENRAIIHVSSLCALYCRFCFRKFHLNDSERKLYDGSLEDTFSYLQVHPEIREVILTGGDPLSITDAALSQLLERLASITHIQHVRIHSRMPVTLPSRITDSLVAILAAQRFVVSVVSHFNHGRELTPLARQKLEKLRRSGVPIFNQSVLLNGVNDSIEVLAPLFQELYELGVRPFYLHHPDWTPGTFHFRISIQRGRKIAQDLTGRLSGPAQPAYVLDMPGGLGKIPLLDADRVQLVESYSDRTFEGAMYEIKPPWTRVSSKSSLYFDLVKKP